MFPILANKFTVGRWINKLFFPKVKAECSGLTTSSLPVQWYSVHFITIAEVLRTNPLTTSGVPPPTSEVSSTEPSTPEQSTTSRITTEDHTTTALQTTPGRHIIRKSRGGRKPGSVLNLIILSIFLVLCLCEMKITHIRLISPNSEKQRVPLLTRRFRSCRHCLSLLFA